MFGSTATTQPSGGFSFGGAASTHATGAGGFSFGGGAPAAAAAPASGGFGFGTSTPAAAPASGGFSFGGTNTATAAPASTGFGFGTGATGTTGTTPGFGFGTSAAGSKPPLFGQGTTTTAPTASTGGFGFGTGATTTGSSFGGFGSTATAAKPATTTGFGFGSGATGTTGTAGFGFGSGASTGTTGFGFGSGATGTTLGGGATSFGAAPAAVSTPAPIIVGADASAAQLNSIKYAYQDPMQSRFKFLMYNTVDPSQRHLYVRPPHISERLWEQAEQDNPDPLNSVPVPVTGFKDLLKRIQVQQDYAEKYNNYTDDLRNQLKEMEKTSRATEEKLEKCRHEHVQLAHMLVKVMKDIEFLQNLGKPLQREEMNLAMALKKLQTLLDSPGQYKARLNDAIALQRIQDAAPRPPTSQMSPDDLQRIFAFLDKQRQGLEHLTTLLNDDLADIKLMKETWRR
ncbi:hypothetical protein Poli38472_001340 [Pythium oligandrum]|uniref:Nucleoporin Nup54 alpha-helical domain-containing protein n=1 Tax=Pythium oligandrum TaxID=41045 RepID=A0A8K1CTX7_PYTOL|nr:hypothetical protein Poli38472_001340 [Pythium oligandrum]|eukprot:TMW69184.1 hypothetical protein Poli38472_001340 [Pythium oligandrum]